MAYWMPKPNKITFYGRHGAFTITLETDATKMGKISQLDTYSTLGALCSYSSLLDASFSSLISLVKKKINFKGEMSKSERVHTTATNPDVSNRNY